MVFEKIKPSVEAWKKVFFSPKTAIRAECEKKAGIMEGMAHIAIGTTIMFAIIIIAVILLVIGAMALGGNLAKAATVAGVILPLMLIYYVIVLISNMVNTFMMNGFYFIVASLQKGKGTYDKQLYVMSVETAATMLAMLPALALMIVILFGLGMGGQGTIALLLMFVPVLLVWLYDAYLKIKVLQAVHALTFWKAFLAWFAPVALLIAFMAIYIGFLMAIGFGSKLGRP